jgi:hypothetical protein
MSPSEYNALLDRRSEPSVRAVLEDMQCERGEQPMRLGLALRIDAAADDASADDASADDADDVAADAAASASADADADAAAADADDADADADAAAADAAIKSLHQLLREEPDMRNGLKIIAYLPGRYGYGLTRIGWLRRVSGDEYELIGARTLWRTRGNYQMGGLNKLAAEGLGEDYGASEADELPEELHRLLVRRVLICDEKKWANGRAPMPKPRGWVDQ